MNKILVASIMLAIGLPVGGGAALGLSFVLPAHPKAEQKPADPDPIFVPTGKLLAPLVFPDGRLSGYVSFEVNLETTADGASFITPRLPLLLHAINMRTYRTPMAHGPDGMLPDLSVFRTIVMDASAEAFGKGAVRRAIITQVVPA